jgi:hypothetical protein
MKKYFGFGITLTLCIAALFESCANRGIGPQGGPKDTIPPVVVRVVPEDGSVNYQGKSVTIHCNEYIQLDNIAGNLLISPPQRQQPEITQTGKMLKLVFADEMKDSTTYSLDFGSAICDFHEKNALKGYSIAFATGPEIDTLEVHGNVLNAQDLNPVGNIIVGLQANLSDSAFEHEVLTRIARTDAQGGFAIHNIHSADYRLYALNDISRDYVYNPGEGLAWQDSLVTPVCVTDSAGNVYTAPADLLLWYFTENKRKQSLGRTRREEAHRIVVSFTAPMDSTPVITPLDSVSPQQLFIQYGQNRDSVIIWLKDSALIARDSVRFEISYYRSDSLLNLEPATDTLRALYRAPNLSAKAQAAKNKEEQNRRVELSSNARNGVDVSDTLFIRASYPIERIITDSIHLKKKTGIEQWEPVPFEIVPRDSAHLSYWVIAELEKGGMYELKADSNALWDIYGKSNKERSFSLTLKKDEDYSTLTIKMTHYSPEMRLQLLDEKDQPVRDVKAVEEGTVFRYLEPKGYYLRMYLDLNGDGRWTTGDWELKRQPEPVYYFRSKLSLKANWEFEESFDHTAVPQRDSKPQEIRKDTNAKK